MKYFGHQEKPPTEKDLAGFVEPRVARASRDHLHIVAELNEVEDVSFGPTLASGKARTEKHDALLLNPLEDIRR